MIKPYERPVKRSSRLAERMLTKNWGIESSHTLAVYRARGGYRALEKALRTMGAM